MKKMITLLVSAVVAQGFATSAMAKGPIDGKVYGKINTAIVIMDDGTTNDTYLTNNASRLGFKGKTELNNNLTAIYKLEYEIAPDEKAADASGSGIFKQRNAYVGLSHKTLGTVFAGSNDTPTKLAQGKIDQFNDLPIGDIKNLSKKLEVRANDVVVYVSPKFSDVTVTAASVLPEGAGTNALSISAVYKKDAVYVAVAMDDAVQGDNTSALRIAGQYKMGNVKLGAIVDSYDNGTDSTDGVIFSVAYKMDAITLKGQFGQSDISAEGREQLALGADYKLGKQTKLFAAYITLEDDAGTDDSALMAGMEHKF